MNEKVFNLSKAILALLIILSLFACDKGKKPYQEAETLFNKSDYAAAKSKAAEVIQNAPNSKYLAQAKALYEKTEKVETLFKTAGEAEQSGDYKKAINDYEGILALDSKSPKAIEELERIKAAYKGRLMQQSKEFVENGEFEKGIESYREILTFARNDKDVIDALNSAETTFANLKQTGDEAMRQFRIYIKTRGTRDYEGAEYARIRYVQKARELYKVPGGRKYLAVILKEYIAEVGTALNDILSKADVAQNAGGYEKRVLAADEYNQALERFTDKYGQPEAWLEGRGRQILRNKEVGQWMPGS